MQEPNKPDKLKILMLAKEELIFPSKYSLKKCKKSYYQNADNYTVKCFFALRSKKLIKITESCFQKIRINITVFSLLFLAVVLTPLYLNIIPQAEAEDVLFNVSYSSHDYQFGSSLAHILEGLSQNMLNKKDVLNLANKQKKLTAFPQFKNLIKRMILIGEIKDKNSFYRSCSPIDKTSKDFSKGFEESININLDRYCRYLYLKRLSQLPSSTFLSSLDFKYLKSSTAFYVSGEHHFELVSFFKKFKSNSETSRKISDIIGQKFIEFKIRPSSALIRQMNISKKFNYFLQENINFDDKSTNSFQKEYMSTSSMASEAIKQGDYFLAEQLALSNLRFYKKNRSFINDDMVWITITLMAKDLYYKGKTKDAKKFFSIAKSIAPISRRQESIYNLIWSDIVFKDDSGLIATIRDNDLEKKFYKFGSKLQYWIAYAFLKNGDQKKAYKLFNQIISTTPYSFYSILALKTLAMDAKEKTSEKEIIAKLIHQKDFVDHSIKSLSDNFKSSLKRLGIWLKLGNEKMIASEVSYIQSLKKEEIFREPSYGKQVNVLQCNDFLTLNLIRLFNSKGQFLTSFKLFTDSLGKNSLALNYKVVKYLFPFKYFDIIKKNAKDLDPLLIISLVRQESSFNPLALSRVGAKGLMQLMPATAKRFNRKVRTKHLVDPTVNIKIGIKYLENLTERYNGNLIYVLASYNAGENRVERWKKDIFKSEDPLAIIEAIPYKETRNYVKLIYRNYFFYSLLSQSSILMTPIKDSFFIQSKNKI